MPTKKAEIAKARHLVEACVDAGTLGLDLVLGDRAQAQTELGVLDLVAGPDCENGHGEEGVVVGELGRLNRQIVWREGTRQRHRRQSASSQRRSGRSLPAPVTR